MEGEKEKRKREQEAERKGEVAGRIYKTFCLFRNQISF
jgi:hypothetical protein